MTHTPTPWKLIESNHDFEVVDSKGETVFDDGSAAAEYSATCSREDAAFIVRAVNNFEFLLKLAENYATAIDSQLPVLATEIRKYITEARGITCL